MSAADTTLAAALLGLAVVMAAGSLAGGLAQRLRQPAVIGEIIAGLALGPSLLGLLPADPSTMLFPPAGQPILGALGNVGVILFMFVMGYEVDLGQLHRTRAAVACVATGSIAVPLGLGAATGFLLYTWRRHDDVPAHVGASAFVPYLAVALSITAFPVLARILADLHVHRGALGSFAMSCAALTDVVAWGLLAVVVLLASGGSWLAMTLRAGGMLLFMAVLAWLVRPLLARVLPAPRLHRAGSRPATLVLLVGLLISAWLTTRLGFHPIFGAFLFGAAVPRTVIGAAAPEAPMMIERMGRLLLPVFFVTTGLGADVTKVGWDGAVQLLLVISVACAGKFAGATGAARLAGMPGRPAAAMGVLMNCRGLTELVAIQTGLSIGVLTHELATIMIIMAAVTTTMTAPVFRRLYGDGLLHGYGSAPGPTQDAATSGRRGAVPAVLTDEG